MSQMDFLSKNEDHCNNN